MRTVYVDFKVSDGSPRVSFRVPGTKRPIAYTDGNCTESMERFGYRSIAESAPEPHGDAAVVRPTDEASSHVSTPEKTSTADEALAFRAELSAGWALEHARERLGIGDLPVRWAITPPDTTWPFEAARDRNAKGAALAFGSADAMVRWVPCARPNRLAVDDEQLRVLQVVSSRVPSRYRALRPLPEEKIVRDLEESAANADGVQPPRVVTSMDEFTDALIEFRPHVIDINSHGMPGRLFWDGEEISAERLAETVEGHPVSLVKLDTCHSADGTDEGASSIASSLVGAGVPAVIGWQGAAENFHSSWFSTRLFSALFAGADVDEAMTEGRMGVRDFGKRPIWSNALVYTSTNESVLRPALRADWLAEQSGELATTRESLREADEAFIAPVRKVSAYMFEDLETLDLDVATTANDKDVTVKHVKHAKVKIDC